MKKTAAFLLMVMLAGMNSCAGAAPPPPQTRNAAPQTAQASAPPTAPAESQQTAQPIQLAQARPQQAPAQAQPQPVASKPKVAVYVTGGKTPAENKALTTRITHALVNSGRYSTIEREDVFLDQVAREMTTQRSGAIDDRQISKLGMQAGANFVCVGEILEVFGDHQVSARIINVVTVEVIASGVAEGALRSINDFASLTNSVIASMFGATTIPTTAASGRPAAQTQAAPAPAQAAQPAQAQKQQTASGTAITVPGSSLMQKLEWLQENAASNTDHRVILTSNEKIEPQTLSYTGKRNVTVRLIGSGGGKAIALTGKGSLFTIESGVTLIVDNDVTLQGHENEAALVTVGNRGALVLNEGGVITGNTNRFVNTNTSGGNGGGVLVMSNGNFTITGGEISGNSATGCSGYCSGGSGGGGIFIMSSGNVTMTGGEISGNRTKAYGGGVCASGVGASFTMTGGVVSGNAAPNGGGISASEDGRIALRDGKVSGNTASGSGGGIFLTSNGNFTMAGGEISSNMASSQGGGVSAWHGSISKTGGTIYGETAGDINSNRASSSEGHAAHRFNGKRQTTAGPKVNLDSSKDGAAGGWE